MSDTAQIDRILSEVNELEERDKIVLFNKIEEISDNLSAQQDDSISIESAFGLWRGRNITAETVRRKAWKNE